MIIAKTHSRKLSFLVAILILLTGVFLGGYLVLKSGKVSAGQLDDILKGNSVNPAVCEPNAGDANKDSDNDGLKDWQEIQIYQSDPCKIDSDNDGYLDGEEVTSGYNPIVKAPGDELPGTLPKGARPLPANLTAALSSMLSQQITTGKIDSFTQQGQILSSSELEKYPTLQQSIRQITSASDQLFAPDPIDESQIKITDDNSKNAIQKYALAVMKAIYPNGPPSQQTTAEIDILLKAMENNDFTETDTELNDYQTAYQQLLRITVPTKLIDLHIKQLNFFSTIIKIYQNVKTTNEDPLKTILALQAYQNTLDQLSAWTNKLGKFIETNFSKQ